MKNRTYIKKLTALGLSASMTLAMAACTKDGRDDQSKAAETDSQATTLAESETEAPSLVEDESATADETAQETEKETAQETVFETEAEKTLSADDIYTEANINIRRGGRVAHANGYTYFVQAGYDNDSRENGQPNSENVYRIADSEPEGEAELLFKLPSYFEYGTAQDTIFCLLPGKDSLFFVDNTGQIYWYEYGDNFVRSPRQMNSDLGLVERVRLKQCISRTEDKVYFLGETVESYDSATGETTLRPICCVLNINSGRGELME
ncbi:MAG: hypothetical protein II468_05130, partial [Lachnospiraceae bacterium]|nr:hypothetical protein [Lachnospiraceae bacterium]